MFQRQWKQAQRPRKNAARSRVAGKKPTTVKKKPAWDNTVSDLTVHQLSKEELALRHSRIMSKNADKAKRELDDMAKGMRQLSMAVNQQNSPMAKPSGRAPTKEKLHSVLEESDQAASIARDLFYDDPKRYSGQPNVTVAPHVTKNKASLQRTLLENRRDGPNPSAINSPGGIRDESVLGLAPVKPALNDLPSPSSDFSLDESSFDSSSLMVTPPTSSSYQPRVIDLPRFQQLVDESEENEGDEVKEREGESDEELSSITGSQQAVGTVDSTADPTEGADGLSRNPTTDEQWTKVPLQKPHSHPLQIVHKMPQTTESGAAPQIMAGRPPPHHFGVLSRNQRVRKLPPGQPPTIGIGSSGIHDDLAMLQKLVEDLESELKEYEETSGFSFPVQKPTNKQNGTFTSLTVSLLASVTKLTHYLKQSEVQLKGEVAVRNQLLHAMSEQQNLMDALTADVVKLQEEKDSLRNRFQQLEASTVQQTKTLKEDVLDLCEKLCALEQAKSVAVKDSSTSTSDYEIGTTGKSPPVVPCTLTQSQVTKPSLIHSSTLSPSYLSTLRDTVTTSSYDPSFTASNTLTLSSLAPTPGFQSTKPFPTLNTNSYSPYLWSTTHPGMESTPLLYQTPVSQNKSLSLTPTPQYATDLSTATMSPSDIDVSHLPLNLGPRPPPPPIVPRTLPMSTLTQPVQSNPPHSLAPPVSFQSPYTRGRPLPPNSLPYSWELPTPQSTTTIPGISSLRTPSTSTTLVVSSAPPTGTLSSLKLGPTAVVARPDLSLSVNSLPAPSKSIGSSAQEVSPSQSESSLDIEASLARMSSLARSVLQELAHDRGHLVKNSQSPYSSPLPSHSDNSPHDSATADTESMITDQSLASTSKETVDSTLTQVSPLSHNESNLTPLPSTSEI